MDLIFYIYLFGYMGFLVVGFELLAVACGIQFSDQRLNLSPLHWEFGILATGPPGKSLFSVFWVLKKIIIIIATLVGLK